MAKSYNDAARERIKKSVLQTERRRTRDIAGEARRIGAGQQLVAGVAAEDIEHKEFGNVELATAGTFDSTFFGDSNRVVSVYNPGEKIWAGSELLYLTASLSGTAFASDGIKSVVFNAFSATEIVGTAAAGILPGSTGTLSSLEPLDGHFGESTLQATLPAGAEEIEAGAAVFARLNYDATGSYWRVVSGAAATVGGSNYQSMVVTYGSVLPDFTPDTYIDPGDTNVSVSWDKSSVDGAVSGATFNTTAGECEYVAGDYLLTAEMSCDNPDADVNTQGSGRYPVGHPSEGGLMESGAIYRFQKFNGASWENVSPINAGHAYPGPNQFAQTVSLRHKLSVSQGESPLRVRVVVTHASIVTTDARNRTFHGVWWTEKF